MQWFLDFLFPPRADTLLLRNVSGSDLVDLLAPKDIRVTYPSTTALLPFRDERVRAAIHETKYHGDMWAAKLLATVVGKHLKSIDADPAHVRLVPIPLGRTRQSERGFNRPLS